MAGNLINTLYPPLVDTFMPAFVCTTSGSIYFSLSPYNESTKINRLHISLIDASTNKYVLKEGEYSEEKAWISDGILVYEWTAENSNIVYDELVGLYRVDIPTTFLKSEYTDGGTAISPNWMIERYYQAQLRLDCSPNRIDTAISYLINDRQYFSEWSSVTLLRPILRPLLYFTSWDQSIFESNPKWQDSNEGERYWAYPQTEALPTFNKGWVDIHATVEWGMDNSSTWNTKSTTEYLDNYRIRIFLSSTPNNPIVDSGILYVGTGEKDTINFLADMNTASVNTNYIVRIDAVSRNGYKWFTEKTLMIASFVADDWALEWNFNTIRLNTYHDESDIIVTEEDGFVECTVDSKYDMRPGWLYIYRSSSVDNYQKNEIIQVTSENGKFSRSFVDKTVCSLVNYHYKAQYKFKVGHNWTPVALSPVYVYPNFYDMLFLRQDKQLAIRFNGQISSFKHNINRVKIDTIGGKYPKFAENARMNYKSFSISGILSAEQDFNRKFLDEKDDLYAPSLEAYDDNIGNEYLLRNDTIISMSDKPFLEGEHDSYLHNNWYWEREFREAAAAWLNDGEPKLFRSMTEGNMIVMVDDVSLTPQSTLGRRLYDFSATVYEIADGTSYADLAEYGIVTLRNDEEINPYNMSAADSMYDDGESIKIRRLYQYIPSEFSNGAHEIVNDVINGTITEYSTLAFSSILERIQAEYKGINSNRVIKGTKTNANSNSRSPIKICDMKLQFTSKPRWYLNDDALNEVQLYEGPTGKSMVLVPGWDKEKQTVEWESIKDNLILGYVIELHTATGTGGGKVFINPKGYYQVPSDVTIVAITVYSGATYTLDCIVEYELGYDNSHTAVATEVVKNIVGQYAGTYAPGVYMSTTVNKKYNNVTYGEGNTITSETLVQKWDGMSWDVTPYALLEYKIPTDPDNVYPVLIGRTGVFTMMTDFPVSNFRFVGRRMVQASYDNRPYLDEWEFFLDDSVSEISDDEINWYADKTLSEVKRAVMQPDEPVGINYGSVRNPSIVRRIPLTTAGKSETNPNVYATIEKTEKWYYNDSDWGTFDDIPDQVIERNTIFAVGSEVENAVISDDTRRVYGKWAYYNTGDIKDPQFNTVYMLTSRESDIPIYVIYYIDHGWYQVQFITENTILAKVPVYGLTDYRCSIVKNTYGSNE